jgi:hypothetical protein
MANSLKEMKLNFFVRLTGYSILLSFVLCQSTIVPTMAGTGIIKTTLNRPINKSELALIKNIKLACSALASESNNPESIAVKFGHITGSTEIRNLKIKPFNRDFNLIDISVSDQLPHAADIIIFRLKSQKKISIASLQQSFGSFRSGVSKLAYRVMRFDIDLSVSGAEKCSASIHYSWKPRNIASAQIYDVSVYLPSIK